MARELTPAQLATCDTIDFGAGPQQVNGLTLLLHMLNARFAPLAEETNLRAVTDLLGFGRRANERTDELLTRFDTLRHRARLTAGFGIGVPGLSFMLLRAIGATAEQQNQLLAPFQGRLPQNENELLTMSSYIRRMGHVIEHHPYNIGASMSNRHTHERQETRNPSGSGNTGPMSGIFMAHDNTPTWGADAPTYTPPPADAPWPGYGAPMYPAAASSAGSSGNGTDTDTSDDSGNEDLDIPVDASMPQSEQAEHVYWQYRQHKRAWRRFLQRAPLRVRRHMKHDGRSCNPRGVFFGGNTKGRGKGGQGATRRTNPRDRDGNVMKCSICSSESHLRKHCPRRQTGGSSGSGAQATGGGNAPWSGVVLPGPLTGVLPPTAEPSSTWFVTGGPAETPSPAVTADMPQDPLAVNDPWQDAAAASRAAASVTPAPPTVDASVATSLLSAAAPSFVPSASTFSSSMPQFAGWPPVPHGGSSSSLLGGGPSVLGHGMGVGLLGGPSSAHGRWTQCPRPRSRCWSATGTGHQLRHDVMDEHCGSSSPCFRT